MLRKLRNYAGTLGWLGRDLARFAGWRLLAVGGLSAAGVFCRAGAIGTLMLFVHAQTKNAPVVIAGMTVPTDTSLPSLAAWGAAALVLSVLTGLAAYGADTMAFAVGRGYLHHSAGRVLSIIASGRRVRVPATAASDPERFLRKLLVGDMFMMLRLVGVVLRAITPVVTLIVAVVTLVAINWLMTLVVAAVLIGYMVPFYRLNRGVVRASRGRETHGRAMGGAVSRIVGWLVQTTPTHATGVDWERRYAATPSTVGNIHALRGILLASSKVQLLQDVFLGVVLGTLVIAFGAWFIDADTSWGPFLTYLVALRYAATSMTQTASSSTRVNRFLPQAERYVHFRCMNAGAEAAADRAPAEHPPLEEPIRLRVRASDLPGSRPSAKIEPGHVVCWIDPRGFDPLDPTRLWRSGGVPDPEDLAGRTHVLGPSPPVPPLRLREMLAGASASDDEALRAILQRLGVADDLDRLPEGLDTDIDPDVAGSMSASLRYALGVVPGLLAGRPVFVLWADERGAFSRLPEAFRARLLEVLRDRVVLLVFANAPEQLPPEARQVVIASEDGSGVRGTGDGGWYETVKGALRPAEDRATPGRVGDAGPGGEDADLDDDDDL